MWMIIGQVLLAIIICVIELPSLIKAKAKKEIWLFSFLLLTALTMSILIAVDVKLPPLLLPLEIIFEPTSNAFFSLFK